MKSSKVESYFSHASFIIISSSSNSSKVALPQELPDRLVGSPALYPSQGPSSSLSSEASAYTLF